MFLQPELSHLNSQYQKYSQKSRQMKTAMAKVQKAKKEIESKLASKSKDLAFRTNLLKEVYHKKVNYPMKAKIMTDLFEKVNAHHARVVETIENNNTMTITVRSPKDKYLTELMQDMAQSKNYDVSTKMIKKDDNASYYESAIKVGLHGKF
jgi:Tfp pilus assembly major pilin PilA